MVRCLPTTTLSVDPSVLEKRHSFFLQRLSQPYFLLSSSLHCLLQFVNNLCPALHDKGHFPDSKSACMAALPLSVGWKEVLTSELQARVHGGGQFWSVLVNTFPFIRGSHCVKHCLNIVRCTSGLVLTKWKNFSGVAYRRSPRACASMGYRTILLSCTLAQYLDRMFAALLWLFPSKEVNVIFFSHKSPIGGVHQAILPKGRSFSPPRSTSESIPSWCQRSGAELYSTTCL